MVPYFDVEILPILVLNSLINAKSCKVWFFLHVHMLLTAKHPLMTFLSISVVPKFVVIVFVCIFVVFII
jgi:hypothetical protein